MQMLELLRAVEEEVQGLEKTKKYICVQLVVAFKPENKGG